MRAAAFSHGVVIESRRVVMCGVPRIFTADAVDAIGLCLAALKAPSTHPFLSSHSKPNDLISNSAINILDEIPVFGFVDARFSIVG